MRPRAGLGIPVYLCGLCASVVHYFQFLISMNGDEAVAGTLRQFGLSPRSESQIFQICRTIWDPVFAILPRIFI